MSRGVRGTSVSFRLRHLGVISVSLRMKRRQELGDNGRRAWWSSGATPTEFGDEVRILGASLCVLRMIWG